VKLVYETGIGIAAAHPFALRGASSSCRNARPGTLTVRANISF